VNGVVPSPVVAEKALRLLEQNRVHIIAAESGQVRVHGETGNYLVIATAAGVMCSCPAGKDWDPASCSHKVAAQIAWAES